MDITVTRIEKHVSQQLYGDGKLVTYKTGDSYTVTFVHQINDHAIDSDITLYNIDDLSFSKAQNLIMDILKG